MTAGWEKEAFRIRDAKPRHILFLCVANSARSQLGEGIARSLAPPSVKISSAGSQPSKLNPLAVKVLAEIGIDASGQYSKSVEDIPPDDVDVVITLCAEEVCPVFLGKALRVHWGLPDPAGAGEDDEQRLHAFREARDELRKRLARVFEAWPGSCGMTEPVYNALFLCTGNSARSILAEAMLNHLGRGRFRAYSAGSHPTGAVEPLALEVLTGMGVPAAGLRSKGWHELAAPGAPPLHFVFTVCDRAAGEACPVWPGQPITAHWGVADPAAVTGPEAVRKTAFKAALWTLSRRIELFLSLPLEKLDRLALKERLTEIGRS